MPSASAATPRPRRASLAGENAAKYVLSGSDAAPATVEIKAENGVRYTVPQSLNPETMADKLTIRFRVADVYKNRSICVYYVNNHYLSGTVYGVQEAAETYFGKRVSELNLSEAATLAGMFKSPNYYNPEET